MIGVAIIIAILLMFCLFALVDINENIKKSTCFSQQSESKQLDYLRSIRDILKQIDKL